MEWEYIVNYSVSDLGQEYSPFDGFPRIDIGIANLPVLNIVINQKAGAGSGASLDTSVNTQPAFTARQATL